jgi:transcriptional regulator with XRE-family HTH domain
MSFKAYKSYNFTTKDPVIDRLRTIVKDEKLSYQEIHEASDVATSTMYGWFHGKTRRPTHAAVAAVAGALGYHFELVHKRGAKIIKLEAKRAKAR